MALMRNIVLAPYDPKWPAQFAKESALISEVLACVLVSIHHIGSTSGPGLTAKPVIDMCYPAISWFDSAHHEASRVADSMRFNSLHPEPFDCAQDKLRRRMIAAETPIPDFFDSLNRVEPKKRA